MKAVLKNTAFFLFTVCKYHYLCRQITSVLMVMSFSHK